MSTSVIRALGILELLSLAEKPVPLAKVAHELDIPRSTAYKILRDLVDNGFVESSESSTYSIGLKAFEVGTAHLRSGNLVDVVGPQLTKLTRLGITAHYAILDGADVVYLIKEDPPALGVQLASSVGVRLPAACTAVGKSCLAWLTPDQIAAQVQTGGDGADLDALIEELSAVRRDGFSTDEGDTASGIRCVAAPVFDINGPRGAIGVSHLIVSSLDTAMVAREVVEAARDASALLGGKAPR